MLERRDYRRLALIDPVALSPWGSPFEQHVRKYEPAFLEMPADFHRAIVAAYIREASYRGLDEAALAAYLEPWLGTEGCAAFYRQMAQFDLRYTDELEPLYGSMRLPVRILWGEEDRWLPIAQGRRLHQLIAGSEFQPVPSAGHLAQEDAPQVVLAALVEFFSRPD